MNKKRIRDYGIVIGRMIPGPLNKITDVPGVTVGHYTLDDEKHRTGVTVILPAPGNVYADKLTAVAHVINGFGKSAGTLQLDELGELETPIALTNTLNVGKVADGLIGYMLEQCAKEGMECTTINPVVQCNFGRTDNLCIDGRPIGKRIAEKLREEERAECDKGSIMMVIATDIPLSELQLKRVAKRAAVGLIRTGSYLGHGSGDIVLAFTTANRHMRDDGAFRPMLAVNNSFIEEICRACSESVEEAILNAMSTADRVVGYSGKILRGLNEFIPEYL